jgi:hypothetical protein
MLENIAILRDLILVTPIKPEKGNDYFVVPESSNDAGLVVAKGPDAQNGIKVGSLIYFGNDRKTVSIKGKAYTVMGVNNVIGIEKAKEENS